MRPLILAAATAGALLVSACGGDADEAANAALANETDANLMLDAPTNDASAMESAGNAADPVMPVTANGSQVTDSPEILGNSSGGDTGGNTVTGNSSGM